MVEAFGWRDPIGNVVQVDDSTRWNVIGVVQNFYQNGVLRPVEPMAIRPSEEDDINFLVVKASGNPVEVKKALEASWYQVIPNTPFDVEYESTMTNAAEVNKNLMIIFRFLGVLALVLSVIGLYTLVSLDTLKRVKEIGVRKVLGASIRQIIFLLNKQFLWLLLIAICLGASLSYLAIDGLMSTIFSVYQAASLATIFLPTLLILSLALSIAAARIFSTAIQNPVKSLRYE